MLQDYDFVRVVKVFSTERQPFLNAIGVVIETEWQKSFDVKFQQKRLRDLSDELGGLLWRESELEAL